MHDIPLEKNPFFSIMKKILFTHHMQDLSDILFPNISQTPEDIFEKYPKRTQKIVTRVAPSPTGFLHIGAIYSALLNHIFAHKQDGIFFLRIEDTDKKREVPGAVQLFREVLGQFDLHFDEWVIGENDTDVGNYGPYTQSQRENIYKVFIKYLLRKDLAYPCFLTEEEISDIRQIQEISKKPLWIYKEYSKWRYAKKEDVLQALEEKKPFVIRFKSPGDASQKIEVEDLVKGKFSLQENFLDIVICKANGIPTYHFAHLIDDFLMGTTHVIRWDEWFPSLPLHKQLFETMNWTPPKYAHFWPLVKMEWNSRRKLSKRKDPEANAQYYFENGFLAESVIDFLCNILNSGFEDWRKEHPHANYIDFDFDISRVNPSGALVDLEKLKSVNAQTMKNMPFDMLFAKIEAFLQTYENDFYVHIFQKAPKFLHEKIITELQTRLVTLDEYPTLTHFLYTDISPSEKMIELLVNPKMKITDVKMAQDGLTLAENIMENITDTMTLEDIKNIFIEGISKNSMKNGQVLWPVRVALSGEQFSPGALELIYILWVEKTTQRLKNILNFLENRV